ncbi:hypothetical protein D5086_025961 [Populus alba]|uniref:Uncharacterized protein n=1 Tax=Populus alba TaxID=43335 RepID=A0ACC4B135_POPAL
MSIITVSASKHSNLLRLLTSHTFLRRLSTEPPEPQPPPQQKTSNHNSIITEALQLLQTPGNEWNTTQLNQLLFPDSPPSSSSPRLFYQITRRLPSSSQALKFLNYLQNNSPSSPDTQSLLSYTFQAIFELAFCEPESNANLSRLYKTSKELNIPLTVNAASFLLRAYGRSELVEESFILFNDLDPSVKTTYLRNVWLSILLRSGRVKDALKVIDEMFESNEDSNCRPNDATGDVLFSFLLKRERNGEILSEDEIVNLVLKFGDHGVLISSFWMGRLITRLCRNRKTNRAWDLFTEMIKLGAVLESATCNSLLTGLAREGNFNRMNELMAKMVEMDIQPNVVTFGILINHMCNKTGDLKFAQKVMRKMIKAGVVPTVATYGALINAYCLNGNVNEAMEIFKDMKAASKVPPNTVIYNILIDSLCKNNKVKSAVSLMEDMKIRGVTPNTTTYNAIFKGLRDEKDLEKVFEFMDRMIEHACNPDYITMEILTEWLSAVGEIERLKKFVAGCEVSGSSAQKASART